MYLQSEIAIYHRCRTGGKYQQRWQSIHALISNFVHLLYRKNTICFVYDTIHNAVYYKYVMSCWLSLHVYPNLTLRLKYIYIYIMAKWVTIILWITMQIIWTEDVDEHTDTGSVTC